MTALLRILVILLLATPCFAQQLPFFTKEGNWISLYTSSGAPATPVYTNSMHEQSIPLWQLTKFEYLMDNDNLTWRNNKYTNNTAYASGLNIVTNQYQYLALTNNVDGWTNGYMNCDGVNDWANTTNFALDYLNTNTFTIMGWLLWTSNSANTLLDAFYSGNNSGDAGTRIEIGIDKNYTGIAGMSPNAFYISRGAEANPWATAIGTAPPTNTWTHLAFVYNIKSIPRWQMFTNGANLPFSSTNNTHTYRHSRVWLGGRYDANWDWKGWLDGWTYFETNLTANAILTNYQSTAYCHTNKM